MDQSFEAIVLRRTTVGETDRKLIVFSKEAGKIDLVAKGARKPTSRLSSASEPLAHAIFQAATGKRQLFVTQIQVKPSILGLRDDYDRLSMALAFAELVDAVSPYEEVNENLFELTLWGLTIIGLHENPKLVLLWMLVKLLDICGLQPSWALCIKSNKRLSQHDAYFSMEQGGFVSQPQMAVDSFSIEGEVLIGLEKLSTLSKPPDTMKRLNECLRLLLKIWQFHAHKPVPALESCLNATLNELQKKS